MPAPGTALAGGADSIFDVAPRCCAAPRHVSSRQFASLHCVVLFGDSRWPNNDGVDFESCTDVEIVSSSFDVGDDGIVFSSGNTN